MKSDIKPLPSEAILCGIRYTIQAHEGIVIFEHGCFRRLSGDGPFKCELEPLGQIPNNRKSSEPHKKFWPSPDDRTNAGCESNQRCAQFETVETAGHFLL